MSSSSQGAAQVVADDADDDSWQQEWMKALGRWQSRYRGKGLLFSTAELIESAEAMHRRVVLRVVAKHHLSTAIDNCAPYGLPQVATRTVSAGICR